MVKRWLAEQVYTRVTTAPDTEYVLASDYDAIYRLLRLSWSVDDIEWALREHAALNRGDEPR